MNKTFEVVTIESTKRCNLNCEHCYLGTELNKPDGLSTKDIKNILEKLRYLNIKVIVFTGGEPFLRKDIIEIIDYAKKLRFRDIRIMTNGILIDPKIIKFLKNSDIEVYISLYGHCARIHEKITRKKGSFRKTLNTIKKLKAKGVKIIINHLLLSINIENTVDMIVLSKILGVYVSFSYELLPRFGYKKYSKYAIKEEDIKIIESLKKSNKKFKLDNKHNLKKKKICRFLSKIFAINSEGFIIPEVLFPMKIGDLKKESIHNILNSKKYNDLKKYSLSDINKKCKSCKLLNFCTLCPAARYIFTGNYKNCSKETLKKAKEIKALA